MRRILSVAAFLTALTLSTAATAVPVDNFVLLDHKGQAHELYYQTDVKALAVFVQGNGCPIARNAYIDLNGLREAFADKSVRFLMLNANLQDERDTVAKEAEEWDIDLPVLVDSTQLVGESLGLKRTAEMLIFDTSTWEIAYRGPINDRLDYERQKDEASKHYAADALNAVLSGEAVEVAQRPGKGCLINFAEANKDHSQISYTETIAPLIQEKCAVCHTEGGIGPWAMSSYEMVRGFAPMIREVLRTKRMPPWHADPHIGTFIGDRSLTDAQVSTLVHWIEAGAPRGEGPDPLKEEPVAFIEWPLGEPDMIVEVPEFTVPASGVVDYQFPVVKNTLDKPVWVRAATVVPGDRKVVHHVLMGASDPGHVPTDDESVFDNYIIGYAPGNESAEMPEGTGVYVAPDSYFLLQMHYTPYGKEAVDRTRVGLYFHDEPPKNFLRHNVVIDPTINIPPNNSAYEEAAYLEFDKDALIYSLVPHAHYRGKASRFELAYPNGEREVILSVPNYDFNWQRTYEFTEPKAIPAGTRLIHATVYDNSARNPGNPNPETNVPWGLQSWDEMLYGAVSYAWQHETSAEPIHNKDLSETYQWVGFLDRDMDGKLSWEELPKRIKKRLVQGFKMVDRNEDGGLDAVELYEMNRRQTAAASGR